VYGISVYFWAAFNALRVLSLVLMASRYSRSIFGRDPGLAFRGTVTESDLIDATMRVTKVRRFDTQAATQTIRCGLYFDGAADGASLRRVYDNPLPWAIGTRTARIDFATELLFRRSIDGSGGDVSRAFCGLTFATREPLLSRSRGGRCKLTLRETYRRAFRNASNVESQQSCIHLMLSHTARARPLLRCSPLRSRQHYRKETG
jgi:hypothetical protein